MGYRLGLALLISFLAALNVSAAPAPARVDRVQMPAWLERAGSPVPMSPGLEVRNGDRLRTGPGARVYLRLAEGSTIKLGESARVVFHHRGDSPESHFRGAMEVLIGAFRFTTDLLRRLEEREMVIRVGTATIGIRGTDVWGRTTPEQDLVMLLEGRIDISPAAGSTFAMAEPLTAYVALRGQAGTVVGVSQAELQARARETEILPGDGAVGPGGAWSLVLGAPADEEVALERYERARAAGFAVHIRPLAAQRGSWTYEVLLPGFADEAEARAAASRIQAALGLEARPRP